MNNTKWNELQAAMIKLEADSPKWRTCCTTNGYISDWDNEWFYHFSEGGFDDIEWAELKIENEKHKELVYSILKKIHVPGHETENGFKVYGYIKSGEKVDYI
ncbi:MAG: hypothetical protein OEQ39_12440 [Gammaproteobacteria bacterium]|nr:hypothetical protein [Gammaproteobacteria bacterium]